ncbi:MAG: extracellular solute-binding protein [Patescibacteria group bacterium]|nr:extracellular solute-binding protein [Patescibacteria group bacterium]
MNAQKIFLIIILLSILAVVGWFITGCPPLSRCPGIRFNPEEPKGVSLKFIGPYDNASEWSGIISRFNAYKKRPENGFINVNISYERICNPICKSSDYEETIQERQFKGKGPNIFMIFNTWIPEYKNKIIPNTTMSINQFEDTFVKVAVDDLTEGKTIYALPFYIDTLALFYNEDKFINEDYIDEYPKDWNEFEDYVEKLTKFDEDGNIEVAGAAFGGGSNVARSQDMLMLLVMQNNMRHGGNIASFNNIGSKPAIGFYTSFTNPKKRFYTWNEDQIYSIDAFTQRKAAMMINYSYGIQNIISKTGNTLNFKVAPIPQADPNNKVNYASYWVPVVPKYAPCIAEKGVVVDCKKLAWEFLNFAAQKGNSKLYLSSSDKPAANKELAMEQAGDQYNTQSHFAGQVFTAKSWYHPETSKSDEYLDNMINSIITADEDEKKSIPEAMEIVKRRVKGTN